MKLHDRVLIRKYIIINILLVGIFVVSFVLKFRIARDYMPLAKIGEVIGYSQYFGYPFLLDTLIVLFVLSIPFISLVLIKILEKYTK